MSSEKHSGSEPENMHNFMDCEENSGTERLDSRTGEDGPSSVDPNLISGCLNSQPSTSGYIGQKRKSHFSSPSATKISRNISNEEQQQEAHLSVNKTNLNEITEVASVSKMMLTDNDDLSSSVTSDNKSSASVSGCIDSSNFNISAHAIDNTSTAACKSKTSHSCVDLDVVKGRIILPIDTGGLATRTNGKSFSCNFCHNVRKDLSIPKHEKHFRCHKCGMFSSVQKHHAICTDSWDSDN